MTMMGRATLNDVVLE